MEQIFYVTKLKNRNYNVKTTYNNYQIIMDSVKGICIYMDTTDKSILIKSYRHLNVNTAITYLFNKEML